MLNNKSDNAVLSEYVVFIFVKRAVMYIRIASEPFLCCVISMLYV